MATVRLKNLFDLETRTKLLLERQIRVFHTPDFDDPKKREDILADMPDLEKFQYLQKQITTMQSSQKISPEMRPCYEEPLLSKEQEIHLFRKMNYFKYMAKNMIVKLETKPTRRLVLNIEKCLKEAEGVRNSIASSNFRLVTQLLRKKSQYRRQQGIVDGILSDAYLDVLKAVDYFNYNLGNKFSTYCTWVLRKNCNRENQNRAKYGERFSTGMDENLSELLSATNDSIYKESNYDNNKKIVSKLFSLLTKDGTDEEYSRQAFAIQEWYGLNGKTKRTLEDISQEMKITKERVRQLKQKGLQVMKERAEELDITFDQLV